MRQLQPNHWTTSDHHRSADQWEVCIHGEEMLGTSLRNMSAPTHGSKWSDAARKARAQAVPIAKKKRRLNELDDRGEGRRARDPIATAISTKAITEIAETGATRQRGAWSATSNDTSGTGGDMWGTWARQGQCGDFQFGLVVNSTQDFVIFPSSSGLRKMHSQDENA